MTIRYPTDAGDPHGVNVEADNTLLTNPVSVRLPQASDPCQADVINAPAKELRDRLDLVEKNCVWNWSASEQHMEHDSDVSIYVKGEHSFSFDSEERVSFGIADPQGIVRYPEIEMYPEIMRLDGGDNSDISIEAGKDLTLIASHKLEIGSRFSVKPTFPVGFTTAGTEVECNIDGTLIVDHIGSQQNLVMDETTIFSKNAQVNGTLSTNAIAPKSGARVDITGTTRANGRLEVTGNAEVAGSLNVSGSVDAYNGVNTDAIGSYNGGSSVLMRDLVDCRGGLLGWQLHIASDHHTNVNCISLACGSHVVCASETYQNVAAFIKNNKLNLVLIGGECPNAAETGSSNQNAKTLRLLGGDAAAWTTAQIESRLYKALTADLAQGRAADYIGMNIAGV